MDLKQFTQSIQQIADEKGIARDKIIEAIEMALAAAYKRDYGKRGQIVRVTLDPDTGKATVRQIKIVVDETMIKSEEEVKAEEEGRAAQFEKLSEPRSKHEERAERLLEAAGAVKKEPEEKREEKSASVGVAPVLSSGSLTEGGEDKSISVKAMAGKEEEDEKKEDEKKVRFNLERHIMIEEARKIKDDVKPGDELEFTLEYHEEYGRIAAQTAKQVIIQRIREVERAAVYEEYKGKEGELVSGLVQRLEGRNVFVDIGRTVGVLPPEEQISYERYRMGDRIKTLIILVEQNPKGPGVFLSRSHPRLLKKLFEMEVPEIAAETVEIKSIAREPGSRSKVAVVSHESGVDPVGSLVGQKGIRVSTVINELGGEKIDVIAWSEDPADFIANALSPAKVLDVEVNEKRREARAMVPEEQLSLAIGKGGQNVRLAAKLTGWKIDVRSSKSAAVAEGEDAESQKPEDMTTVEEASQAVKEVLAEVLKEEAALAIKETRAEVPPEEKIAEEKTEDRGVETKEKASEEKPVKAVKEKKPKKRKTKK